MSFRLIFTSCSLGNPSSPSTDTKTKQNHEILRVLVCYLDKHVEQGSAGYYNSLTLVVSLIYFTLPNARTLTVERLTLTGPMWVLSTQYL